MKAVKLLELVGDFHPFELPTYTQLAFLQVEGVFAERGLSLAHVIGLFTEFFRKCGRLNYWPYSAN